MSVCALLCDLSSQRGPFDFSRSLCCHGKETELFHVVCHRRQCSVTSAVYLWLGRLRLSSPTLLIALVAERRWTFLGSAGNFWCGGFAYRAFLVFIAYRLLSERFSAAALSGLDFIALVPRGTGVVSTLVWNPYLQWAADRGQRCHYLETLVVQLEPFRTWDGHPKGWRRYQREVAWFVQGTKHNQRRYLATRLIGRLSGAARLLAMSWPQQEFDDEQGVLTYMWKLAGSPLVRRSLPNAAAIMAQYFGFKRHPGEQITTFLVRETLGFEEFQEALLRLKDEKHGLTATRQFFGLEGLLSKPDEDTRDREVDTSWWRRGWGRDEDNGWPHEDDADDPQDAGEQAAATSAAEASGYTSSR